MSNIRLYGGVCDGERMSRVFVSYSSKDRDFIVRLADDLKQAGHDVWLDIWKITGRKPYWSEIQEGIESCSHFIFAISPDSIDEEGGAIIELYHAAGLEADRRPVLIPIMVRAVAYSALPILISPGRLQIHDCVQYSYEEMLPHILEALTAETHPPPPAASVEQGKPQRAHRGIKLGSLTVPGWAIIILLLLILVGAAYTAWLSLVPAKMTGVFKVAVAEFGKLDAEGKAQSSDDGKQLSKWLYDGLQNEFQTLGGDLQPQLWHDSLSPFQKRVTIGLIEGDTPEQRREVACQRATDIGADVLIYGNLDPGATPANFTPDFCISPLRRDAGDIGEIVGNHQIGAPIPVELPLSDLGTRTTITDALTGRTSLLWQVTLGLAYDLQSNNQKALDVFTTALNGLETARQDAGKDILYYFIGRENLYLKNLDDAQTAFQNALNISPDYARAHIGLGSVYYTRAQAIKPEERFNGDDMDKAIEEYQQARDIVKKAPDMQVEFQVHLALASAYRLKGEAYAFKTDYSSAESFFDQTIQEVEAGLNLIGSDQHRFRAHGDLIMGTAYQQKATIRLAQGDKAVSRDWFNTALGYYQQCIDESAADPFDQFLRVKLNANGCTPYKKAVEDALANLGTS
jgi:tetratricopeptide (TPR) repeat protein